MTNKEAIETIKIAAAEVEWEYPLDYQIAFDMAVESLEKQIPVKPEAIEDKMYCCPKCNNNLLWIWKKYPIEKTDLREGLPYCLSCGQAIDWSKEC